MTDTTSVTSRDNFAARKHFGDFARIEAGGVTFFQDHGSDDDD